MGNILQDANSPSSKFAPAPRALVLLLELPGKSSPRVKARILSI